MRTMLYTLWISCLVSAGCFSLPAKSSGPSESDGVQMAIVGQYCEDSAEPDDFAGSEAVQLRMKIAVANRSKENVGFDPDRVRVIAPDRVTPSPVAADAALVVAPGETKVAVVRFLTRGSLKCKEEMRLDPSDSLVAGARRVPLRPIAFVAQGGS
jgi:hypothetical protein